MECGDPVVPEEGLTHLLKLLNLLIRKIIGLSGDRIECSQRKGILQLGKDTFFHLSRRLLGKGDA